MKTYSFYILSVILLYIQISALNLHTRSIHSRISSKRSYFSTTFTSKLYCIGTKPFEREPTTEKRDADPTWRTAPSNIVPVDIDKFKVRPQLITFEAFDILIEPSQSVGRWLREALNTHCEMRIRLPRPALFTAAYKKAYADMSRAHPCFGAHSGMTAQAWWSEVIGQTYKSTQDLTTILPEEMDALLPALSRRLYTDIFGSSEGWLLKEDTEYTLQKLREWRDQGAGPRIGVVSNSDSRLIDILKELNIYDTFDFVLTSHESRFEKPQRELFDLALARCNVSDPSLAFHIGSEVDVDVAGAAAAGWNAVRYNEWFDEDFPDWFEIETIETANEGFERRAALQQWGRRDVAKDLTWVELWGLDDILFLFGLPEDDERPLKTTYIRGFRSD